MVQLNLRQNKLELQRDKRKQCVTTNRLALLRAALKRLATNSTLQDRKNRYYKSHRSSEIQNKYEQRIIHITAKRFNLTQGQHFPLRAIILIADKGVRQAVTQYNSLHRAAKSLNISIRDAYDHFILGKELNNLRKAHEPT